MKNSLVSTKKFVQRHHTAITVTAISIVVLQQIGIRQMKDFLKENNLYDEYFTPVD